MIQQQTPAEQRVRDYLAARPMEHFTASELAMRLSTAKGAVTLALAAPYAHHPELHGTPLARWRWEPVAAEPEAAAVVAARSVHAGVHQSVGVEQHRHVWLGTEIREGDGYLATCEEPACTATRIMSVPPLLRRGRVRRAAVP